MKCSLAAILARFDGDRKQAEEYCVEIATQYPRLAEEYGGYCVALCDGRWATDTEYLGGKELDTPRGQGCAIGHHHERRVG